MLRRKIRRGKKKSWRVYTERYQKFETAGCIRRFEGNLRGNLTLIPQLEATSVNKDEERTRLGWASRLKEADGGKKGGWKRNSAQLGALPSSISRGIERIARESSRRWPRRRFHRNYAAKNRAAIRTCLIASNNMKIQSATDGTECSMNILIFAIFPRAVYFCFISIQSVPPSRSPFVARIQCLGSVSNLENSQFSFRAK
ncbi:unnamed protein product [Xylocopa violacea]|uniref:Uncharacterized protein n=1 Tax=Xylocopa violacea TaxID=135666 RepID=A0ABP1P2C1_XYLVO